MQMPKVGEAVVADKVCGEVESTKSVSEIFAPVTGTVVTVNEALVNAPELINSDPYGAGWLVEGKKEEGKCIQEIEGCSFSEIGNRKRRKSFEL